MEKKRFGVKNSRIEELIQFQLSLRSRRQKMPQLFDIYIRVNGQLVRQLVQADDQRISIGTEINSWRLPRQIPQLSEELIENETPEEGNELPTPFQLYYVTTLALTSYMKFSFFFDSFDERAMFLGALGDLDVT